MATVSLFSPSFRVVHRNFFTNLTRPLIPAANQPAPTHLKSSTGMVKRRSRSSVVGTTTTGSEGPKMPSVVANVYNTAYDEAERRVLLALRNLILQTAAEDERIGPLTETLKWGEPAFLTEETKSGSTLRLGRSSLSKTPALFVNCSTPLLAHLQEIDQGGVLEYHGLRDIAVPEITSRNRSMIQTCIRRTLTYHLERKKASASTKKKRTKTASASGKRKRSKN